MLLFISEMKNEDAIIEKRLKMTYLLDIYSPLLTEKQREVLSSFYNDDYNITEIAQEKGITRQAAFDLIKRSENILSDYDEKLCLYEKYIKNCALLDEITALAKNGDTDSVLDTAAKLKEEL